MTIFKTGYKTWYKDVRAANRACSLRLYTRWKSSTARKMSKYWPY